TQTVARNLSPYPGGELRAAEGAARKRVRAHRQPLRKRRHDLAAAAGSLCRACRIARPPTAADPRGVQNSEREEMRRTPDQALAAACAALLLAALLFADTAPDGERWWSYVEALANNQMQGRNTGSPEHLRAARYVAAQFEKAGMRPAGADGFIQPVKFTARKL